jgi:hypothetical protein
MLIKGTIEEIHDFFSEENLENEFQKWHQLITSHEIFIKFDLNLTRRESCNKSFVSNNNDINNNANLGTSINNNSIHKSSNKELNNSIINNSIDNSIYASNNKELNKLGFNNFDEVPDNLISNYRASQHNPLNSSYNKNILNNKNIIMPSPIKMTDNIENKNELDNNNEINSKSQIIPDLNKSQNNIINDKESNTNSVKSEAKEEINLNNKYNKEFNDDTVISKKKENYDNSLNLFKNASINSECKKNSNEKEINKDEKTLQTIRELLGDNNLEIIIKNTNNKNIKKFDIFFKKIKKGMTGTGNFDIKIKNNDFLKNTIKYEYKNKI